VLYIQPSRLICSCYVADQTYICLLRVVKCCIRNISIFFKEHKNIVLKVEGVGEEVKGGQLPGKGVPLMVAP